MGIAPIKVIHNNKFSVHLAHCSELPPPAKAKLHTATRPCSPKPVLKGVFLRRFSSAFKARLLSLLPRGAPTTLRLVFWSYLLRISATQGRIHVFHLSQEAGATTNIRRTWELVKVETPHTRGCDMLGYTTHPPPPPSQETERGRGVGGEGEGADRQRERRRGSEERRGEL